MGTLRCLYEVLEISREADEATIRISYRKAALKWHPDKNQRNLEEASARFKEIQNAYEILSDPREKAWYDTHRSDILQGSGTYQAGDTGFTPSKAPASDIDLFKYFSATCYSGFGNGRKGFFGVYDDVFFRLGQQEAAAAQSVDDFEAAPRFGTSTSDWTSVSAFYSFWQNFTTCKDFSWADKHNPASATNRKMRRLMEDENRKQQKAYRRQYNDRVRELVTFVRKRDKRVAQFQAQEAERRLEADAEEERKWEEEKKERLARARAYEEELWAAEEAEAAARRRSSDGYDIEREEKGVDELYCVACDKLFKSQNAFANHERSKKHLEKVEALRIVLEDEEGGWEVPADDAPGFSSSPEPKNAEQLAVESPACEDNDHEGVEVAQPPPLPAQRGSKAKKRRKRRPGAAAADGASNEADVEQSTDEMLEALLSMRARKANQDDSEEDSAASLQSASSHADLPSQEARNRGHHAGASNGMANAAVDVEAERLAAASLQAEDAPAAKGGKRRRRKAQNSVTGQQIGRGAPADQAAVANSDAISKASTNASATTCLVCGIEFESRTRLFRHIKESGHAALRG